MKRLSLFMFVGIVMSSTFVLGAGREQLNSVRAELAVQAAEQRAQWASGESQLLINQVLNAKSDELQRLGRELEEERTERRRLQAVMAQNERVAEGFNTRVSEENVRRALIENEEARLQGVASQLRSSTSWHATPTPLFVPAVFEEEAQRIVDRLAADKLQAVKQEAQTLIDHARQVANDANENAAFQSQIQFEQRRDLIERGNALDVRERDLVAMEKALRGMVVVQGSEQVSGENGLVVPGREQGSGENGLVVAAGRIVKDFLRRVG